MELLNICRRCKLLLTRQHFPHTPMVQVAAVQYMHTSNQMLKRKKAWEQPEKPVTTYVGKHHKRANRIYLWGNAKTGALGIGKFLVPKADHKNPVLIQSKPYNFHWPIRHDTSVKHVAAGYGFTVYGGKRRDNSVYVFGNGINTDSQLGYHTQHTKALDYVIEPVQIELPTEELQPTEIRSIGCGRGHTIIATDTAIYSLGNNAFGQCGRTVIPDENYQASRMVHSIPRDDVIKVVCGHDHTLLLTNQGKVFSAGLGTDGQTGLGEFSCTGDLTEVRGDIEGVNITAIDCRCDTVLALSDDGQVFGWGNSEYGQFDMITDEQQISRPTHLPLYHLCGRVQSVAATGTNCALVNDKGEAFVWGYGILGKGPNLQQSSEPSILPMPLFGNSEFSKDVTVEKIFSGVNYLAAVTNKKDLYTWGRNTDGCLGLGHREDQYFPFMVAAGSEVNYVVCGADHMVTLCRAYV